MIRSEAQDLLAPQGLQQARAAAVEEAGVPGVVGDHLATRFGDDGVSVTVEFVASLAGYLGWHWAVTLAVVDGDPTTVSEVVLLPGDGALLAPAWVPWDQRVRRGDLGVGDLLPTAPDDERLVPSYLLSDDPAIDDVARELGLGRARVLGRGGRQDIAGRWHDGAFGPGDEMATHAPGRCGTCAFYLPLAGSLGGMFGACGNDMAPADGRVVDIDYGCGAHSEEAALLVEPAVPGGAPIDELVLEIHDRPAAKVVLPLVIDNLTALLAAVLPPTPAALPPAAVRFALSGRSAIAELPAGVTAVAAQDVSPWIMPPIPPPAPMQVDSAGTAERVDGADDD